MRTPAIFWWPGTVRPGTVTDIGSGLDLLTTAASLAGTRPPAGRIIDGVDLSAPLRGSGAEPAPHALLLFGQRAPRRPQGQVQGALHHQRRLRPRRRAHGAHAAAPLRSGRGSRRALRHRRGASRDRRRPDQGSRRASADGRRGEAAVRRAAARAPGRDARQFARASPHLRPPGTRACAPDRPRSGRARVVSRGRRALPRRVSPPASARRRRNPRSPRWCARPRPCCRSARSRR